MSHNNDKLSGWTFFDNGDFFLDDPERSSYLYFPLANEAGMMSSVTPKLNGDSKTGQNNFLLTPVSAEDLHNSKSARNFWFYIEGKGPWSVTGNSPHQIMNKKEEAVSLKAGFLWHQITRENKSFNIKAEVTSFIPVNEDKVELMKVKVTNSGEHELYLTPTAAIPIYGRSADNLRDHRHVTSLLHRITTNRYGVLTRPTLSFDERRHRENKTIYGVFGTEGSGEPPLGFFPVLEEFIGEGGTLEWPEKVVKKAEDFWGACEEIAGYECMGALRFASVQLRPGESRSYIIVMVIGEDTVDLDLLVKKYNTESSFDRFLNGNKNYWERKLSNLSFQTGNQGFDLWLKWVTIQPMLRRIYGCSFLPHHDYGRGGRGWRDLWQDCLALLIMDSADVHYLLLNNFAGVRMDGSNATIIGTKPGEFMADRNNIPRIWSDHGAWPLLTTKLYLDLTGDLEFLLEKQSYFKDHLVHRSKAIDEKWRPRAGNRQKTRDGRIYEGTILEHLLLQNVTAFFNVGEHNNIKLENADWNDALDMAPEKGESVAFTSFYAGNLMELIRFLQALQEKKSIETIEIAVEIMLLFDSLSGKVNYDSVEDKRRVLSGYFESCRHTVTGKKIKVKVEDLVADLQAKAEWMISHLKNNEWVTDGNGLEWFNGYYDNDGNQVEGRCPKGVRMTLTAQVFPIMSGVAEKEQIEKITRAADKYLLDLQIGGYRLNTDFKEIKLNMGRGFGFAYGHKENGSVFNHMTVMYANALYKRGYVHQGHFVLNTLFNHCLNYEKCRIYPGIPEYMNGKGRGMYHYLTGSASWLLLTMVTEVYGVKGCFGDLMLEPKLTKEQFYKSGASLISTVFAERKITVIYRNPNLLDYGQYTVETVQINGQSVDYISKGDKIIITRDKLSYFQTDESIKLTVSLGKKKSLITTPHPE